MRTADGRVGTIRNIVWDVDGTLFDTYPAIARAFRAGLRELGTDAPLARIVELARESLGYCTATLAQAHHLDRALLEATVARHYERTTPEDQPPFPGVRAVCEAVRTVGGRNLIVTHRGPKGTAELLSASGLAEYFSDIITRADEFPRKPDPAAFRAIVARNGLRPDETLAIGDRDIDVLAARAAGLVTCFFGPIDPGLGADLAITDFADLAPLLVADA